MKLKTLGVQEARNGLRTVIDDALIRGIPTVIERHKEPVAVVVPYEWYERAQAALAQAAREADEKA